MSSSFGTVGAADQPALPSVPLRLSDIQKLRHKMVLTEEVHTGGVVAAMDDVLNEISKSANRFSSQWTSTI